MTLSQRLKNKQTDKKKPKIKPTERPCSPRTHNQQCRKAHCRTPASHSASSTFCARNCGRLAAKRPGATEGVSGSSGAPCCFKITVRTFPSSRELGSDPIQGTARAQAAIGGPPTQLHIPGDRSGRGRSRLRLFLVPPPLHPEWRTRPPSLGWTIEDKHLPKRDMLRIAHEHHDARTVVEKERAPRHHHYEAFVQRFSSAKGFSF